MEKELDPDVIKATQSSLGKYVKRPPLSDKLLKKPPFRFLHDIVTTVLKTTGFFEGLFDKEELISENVKDRDSKIVFLNKVITVVGTTTGKNLSVKSSKIVAGQEPDKTNELLQCLAQALDNKLSSKEAVNKYKEGDKPSADQKTKEPVKPIKKTNETKKNASRSSEKLTSNKKDASERSVTKNDKDKTNANKSKQKETILNKKESPPKKTSAQPKALSKNNSVEKPSQNQLETESNKTKRNSLTKNISRDDDALADVSKFDVVNDNIERNSGELLEKHEVPENTASLQLEVTPRCDKENRNKLNSSSYTIGEPDLNASLSSQDLMEVNDHDNQTDTNTVTKPYSDIIAKEQTHSNLERPSSQDDKNSKADCANSRPQSITKGREQVQHNDLTKNTKFDNVQNDIRPKSVRPSSSRPGAPRLREKHDSILVGNENLLVGKVNIIAESAPQEEEEDNSIIIVEQQVEIPLISKDQPEFQLSSNEHGALVQQILDSQKEYSQTAGKTEIEWQFGAQKAREAINQEVEQLRFNIQALSRVANPLGKVLDHMQEDVEVMRQELEEWTKTYEAASKELLKQKTANEDSLFPLHTKLKQLGTDILEKHDKINDLKIIIHKNSIRIEKLLASGGVQ